MKNKYSILFLAALLSAAAPAYAQEEKKDSTAAPEESAYEKLLGPDTQTRKGLVTVHIKKGKTYFEIPDSLYGRDLVLGSTVKSISDNGAGLVGSKQGLQLISLVKEGEKVQIRECNVEYVSDDLELFNSTPGAILASFDIKAFSPDSSAVIDVTDYFLADNEDFSPFVGYSTYDRYKVDKQYKKEYSFVEDAKAFEDNVSVIVSRTYSFSLSEFSGRKVLDKQPLTAQMCYSILLLPDNNYRPRVADPRIGYFFTQRQTMSSVGTSSKTIWLANRWRVEPGRQIVFYIDPCFPEWWKPYIYKAVNDWSKPFERIGFKDAVVARDFPTPEEDPEFDPDNIKYSCIRYQPVGIQNAMGPSWVDPRTGEIINASVYVYHDVVRLVSQWMFIQTAQADKSVRTIDIPREKLGDALEYVVRHEVGHCLGLMHNMGASSCIPVEKLRNPAFTAQNGTTYSIMDYARFNYVAQPGDKVKLTPPDFGKYDYWAIRWGYAPIPEAKSFAEESAICRQMITDSLKVAPWYRYGKQQLSYRYFDPRNQNEDLGDDVIKASRYGVSNLKLVTSGFMDWLSEGDPDYEYRTLVYQGIVNQYLRYANHILMNVGGLYRNEIVAEDGQKRFQNVPGSKQKDCLKEALSMLDKLDWIEDKAILDKLPVIGSPSFTLRRAIFSTLLTRPYFCALSDGVDTEELGFSECMDMIYDFTWKKPRKKGLTAEQRMYQREFVLSLLTTAGMKVPAKANSAAYSELSEGVDYEFGTMTYSPVSGFEWVPRDIFNRGDISAADYYAVLSKVKDTIQSRMKNAKALDKAHYELLLYYIDYGTSAK
ncbi:MAG: zinc-dependent metalloprotease [Bacteroidales bacterium]|nr:zinc-dependent metalloprotease [Bacteroidales bacterium]